MLDKPGADRARLLWREASSRSSSVALIAETRAALTHARRSDRLDADGHEATVAAVAALRRQVDGLVVTDARLAEAAASLGLVAVFPAAP